MRCLLVICLAGLITVPAMAVKTPVECDDPDRMPVDCGLINICIEWDGTFLTEPCGGAPVWQFGPDTSIPGDGCDGVPVGEVAGTILNGLYPNLAGEIAIGLMGFEVTEACRLLEVCHYYDIESFFDGGNLTINGQVVAPIGGYPEAEIFTGAACVGGEPGFSGSSGGWVLDCWDLTPYLGQTIDVAVKFGSDGSVQFPGWYIDTAVIGNNEPVPIDETTWGRIKTWF